MNENTGTKYCRDCKYFYSGGMGQFCTFAKFEGQYTKGCPKKEVKKNDW